MQRTPNYNLLQYQVGDKFLKEDLNDSFSKIDIGLSDLQETVNNASGDAVATTNEVIAARKGEASLVDKINIIDSDLVDMKTQGFIMSDIPTDGLTLGNIMLLPNKIILGNITLG